jgi:chemotaxis signal transduction protein
MTDTQVIFERGLATIRIADVAVLVDVSAIRGVAERAGLVDVVLADVLGCEAVGDPVLVSLDHARGQLVVAIHGTIRVGTERVASACQLPPFVAGALRRSCFRGVVRSGTELAYVLDVERLATRLQSEVPCVSD